MKNKVEINKESISFDHLLSDDKLDVLLAPKIGDNKEGEVRFAPSSPFISTAPQYTSDGGIDTLRIVLEKNNTIVPNPDAKVSKNYDIYNNKENKKLSEGGGIESYNITSLEQLLSVDPNIAISFILLVIKSDEYYIESVEENKTFDLVARGAYRFCVGYLHINRENPIQTSFGDFVFFEPDDRMLKREKDKGSDLWFLFSQIKYAVHQVTGHRKENGKNKRIYDDSKDKYMYLIGLATKEPDHRYRYNTNATNYIKTTRDNNVYYTKEISIKRVGLLSFQIIAEKDGHINYITIMPDKERRDIEKYKKQRNEKGELKYNFNSPLFLPFSSTPEGGISAIKDDPDRSDTVNPIKGNSDADTKISKNSDIDDKKGEKFSTGGLLTHKIVLVEPYFSDEHEESDIYQNVIFNEGGTILYRGFTEDNDFGLYYTPDLSHAKSFGTQIKTINLPDNANVFDINNKNNFNDLLEIVGKIKFDGDGSVFESYKEFIDHDNNLIIAEANNSWIIERYKNEIISMGYNVAKFMDGGTESYLFLNSNPDIRFKNGGSLTLAFSDLIKKSKKYTTAIDVDEIDRKFIKKAGHTLDHLPKGIEIILVDSSLFEKEKGAWEATSKNTIAYHNRPVNDKYWVYEIENGAKPPVLIDTYNDEKQLRVRDGNHRLNVYLSKGIKQIPVVLSISAKDYLDNFKLQENMKYSEGGGVKNDIPFPIGSVVGRYFRYKDNAEYFELVEYNGSESGTVKTREGASVPYTFHKYKSYQLKSDLRSVKGSAVDIKIDTKSRVVEWRNTNYKPTGIFISQSEIDNEKRRGVQTEKEIEWVGVKPAYLMTVEEFKASVTPLVKEYNKFLKNNKESFAKKDYSSLIFAPYNELNEFNKKHRFENNGVVESKINKNPSIELLEQNKVFIKKLAEAFGVDDLSVVQSDEANSPKRSVKRALDAKVYETLIKKRKINYSNVEKIFKSVGLIVPKSIKIADEAVEVKGMTFSKENEFKSKQEQFIIDFKKKFPDVIDYYQKRFYEGNIKLLDKYHYFNKSEFYIKAKSELTREISKNEHIIASAYCKFLGIEVKVNHGKYGGVSYEYGGGWNDVSRRREYVINYEIIENYKEKLNIDCLKDAEYLFEHLGGRVLSELTDVNNIHLDIPKIESGVIVSYTQKGLDCVLNLIYINGYKLQVEAHAVWAGGYNIQKEHMRGLFKMWHDKKILSHKTLVESYKNYSSVPTSTLSEEEIKETKYMIELLKESLVENPDDETKKMLLSMEQKLSGKTSDFGKGGFVPDKSVTNSENFKKWFMRSVVKNGNGSPKVMYHGTRKEFNIFEQGKENTTWHPSRTLGFFFGEKQIAQMFAYPTWKEGEISFKDEFYKRRRKELGINKLKAEQQSLRYNYFNYQKREDAIDRKENRIDKEWEVITHGVKLDWGSGANLMPVFLSIQNPYSMTFSEIIGISDKYKGLTTDDDKIEEKIIDFRKSLIKKGFDGIKIEANPDSTEGEFVQYVAFYPEQIKSAIGNNGNFDAFNADITMEFGGKLGFNDLILNPSARKIKIIKEGDKFEFKNGGGINLDKWMEESPYVKKHIVYVDIKILAKYREFDRRKNPIRGEHYLDELKAQILKNGITTPLSMSYGVEDHRLSIGEGNHRLAIAEELGMEKLPVYVKLYRKNSKGKKVKPLRVVAYDTIYDKETHKMLYPKEFEMSINDLEYDPNNKFNLSEALRDGGKISDKVSQLIKKYGEMSFDEFFKYSSLYQIEEYSDNDTWGSDDKEGWTSSLKKERYFIELLKYTRDGKEIELRKEGDKLQYVAIDKDGEIIRDERGLATYQTDEELIAKGIPLYETSIYAFVGDKVVGWVANSFGVPELFVHPDYRKLGIGIELLYQFLIQENGYFMNKESFLGQYTEDGIRVIKKLHDRFKKESGGDNYKKGGAIKTDKIVFEIIPNEQTPKVKEISDVKEFIFDKLKEINEFLSFASSKYNAVGLSANQVSINGKRFMERFFVYNTGIVDGWKIIINPKIIEYIGEKETKNEGCLSWVGKKIVAKRSDKIRVSYHNIYGKKITGEILFGTMAQIFQHETDHLNGVEQDVQEPNLIESVLYKKGGAVSVVSEKEYNKVNNINESTPIQYHGTTSERANSIRKNGFYKEHNVNITDDYSEAEEYADFLAEDEEGTPEVIKVRLKNGAKSIAKEGIDALAYKSKYVVLDYSETKKITYKKGGELGNVNEIEKINIPDDVMRDFINYRKSYTDDSDEGIYDFENVKKFSKKWLGYNITKKIGEGTNGSAYLTNKGTVLKFSFSKIEADGNIKLLGKKIKHHAYIYNVKQLGNEKLFIIEKEFVNPLGADDNGNNDDHFLMSNHINGRRRETPIFDSIWFNGLHSDDKVKIKKWESELQEIENHFKKEYGIDFLADITADNIGTKDGQLICFDCFKEGGEMDNFDFGSLFNNDAPQNKNEISEEQTREEDYQKSQFSKSWAKTYVEAKEKLIQQYKDAFTVIQDWSSRSYKGNKGSIVVGAEYTEYGESKNIGHINESRRNNRIKSAESDIKDAVRDLKAIGLTGVEIEEIKNSIEKNKFKTGGTILTDNRLIKLSEFKTFKERKDYANENFKKLSHGTSRNVYIYSDKYVLKVAKNPKGIAQNLTESNPEILKKYSDIVAKVTDYNKNGKWLLQQKVEQVDNIEFEDITGFQKRGFLYWLRHKSEELNKWYRSKPLARKFDAFISQFGLDRFDIANDSAWGKINNKVVLLDYGLTLETARKLYHVNYRSGGEVEDGEFDWKSLFLDEYIYIAIEDKNGKRKNAQRYLNNDDQIKAIVNLIDTSTDLGFKVIPITKEEYEGFDFTDDNLSDNKTFKTGGAVHQYRSVGMEGYLVGKSRNPYIGKEIELPSSDKNIRCFASYTNGYPSVIDTYRFIYYFNNKAISVLHFMKLHGTEDLFVLENMFTLGGYRRKGYAEKLFIEAKKQIKEIEFSRKLSSDGRPFVDYLKGKYRQGGSVDLGLSETKVVDSDGKPLIVYNGSVDGKMEIGWEGGIFFTENEDLAKAYSTPNPRREKTIEYNPTVTKAYLIIKNPLIKDFKGDSAYEFDDEIEQAKEEGRDGVILQNLTDHDDDNPETQYIIFDKSQIVELGIEKYIFNDDKTFKTGGEIDQYKKDYYADGSMFHPYDLRIEFADIFSSYPPTEKQIKEMNSWLREHKMSYINLYHGTPESNKANILAKGLLPTSISRTNSMQSQFGYVYLALSPSNSKLFATFGGAKGDDAPVTIFEVTCLVANVMPDHDQLKNKRMATEDYSIGDSLADSFIYGHGARVKGKISNMQLKVITEDSPQYYKRGGAMEWSESNPHPDSGKEIICTLSACCGTSVYRWGVKKAEMVWDKKLQKKIAIGKDYEYICNNCKEYCDVVVKPCFVITDRGKYKEINRENK